MTNGQRYYYLHTYDNMPVQVSAMAFDGDGNLWVITDAGLQVCDQNGRVRAILSLPDLSVLTPDGGPAPVFAWLHILDGAVTIGTHSGTYTRRFNVKAPVPGVRPKSQGQG